VSGPRYIPGSEPIDQPSPSPPVRHQTKTNGTAPKRASVPSPQVPVYIEPTPEPGSKVYFENFPDLEITIKDSVSHDIKYQFRVKSLSALKEFLISEGEGNTNPSQLFLTSAPQKEKTQITYSGIPVVDVYADLFGKEKLESRANTIQREKNLQQMRRGKGYDEYPKVPLLDVQLPSAELVQILTQKGYQQVYLNSKGPLEPLHPRWSPTPFSCAYKKGNAIVYFLVQDDRWVSECELLQTSNSTYKDLLSILLKYGICIFNVSKLAFIAPEQLQ